MRQRARARGPVDVLAQYTRDRFCRRALVDLRTMMAIDAELLAAADDFEALELSPVAPFGTCSTVARTDQNRVLSALRASEVISDPTNVLALECAQRLRAVPSAKAHLVTSHRIVRAQTAPDAPGFEQHFRILALASGGAESKNHAFTVDAMVQHVRTLFRALDRLEQRGYSFGKRRLEVLATPARAEIGDRIAAAWPEIAERKRLDHEYYSGGLRYLLWATTPEGTEIHLGDGGAFDWLAKLTSNRRAVYVASGLGTQLIATRFRSVLRK